MTSLIRLDPSAADHSAAIAEIWNAACHGFPVDAQFVRFNLQSVTGNAQVGWFAADRAQHLGFVIASAMGGAGWIDAIAVRPEAQRRGAGLALLRAAEDWLRAQGARHSYVGGSMRAWTPGVPANLGSAGFFDRQGFRLAGAGKAWDLACDLSSYPPPGRARPQLGGEFRPVRSGDEPAVLEYFERNFPGRWKFEFTEHLRVGGRLSDYMLIMVRDAVEGVCHLTFEDSLQPLTQYHMVGLSRPWGALGAIGVSERVRGQGYGGALLDAGLRQLQAAGVRGCVIDWTDLLGFYGKFGFEPWHEYWMFEKVIAAETRDFIPAPLK